MMSHTNHSEHEEEEMDLKLWQPVVSAVLLAAGILFSAFDLDFFRSSTIRFIWYFAACLPVAFNVVRLCLQSVIKENDFFSEYTLMTIATIGAFAIGEFPEAVAVMLLYNVGEYLQDRAVDKAHDDIRSLLAFRPDTARVVKDGQFEEIHPQDARVGDVIEVRAGERVPLDGILVSADAMFNTAALTGESMPRTIEKDQQVLAGMISQSTTIRLKVIRPSEESEISRILNLVEDATSRKAPTELFIRKFARVYTPVVIGLAALTVLSPYLYALMSNSFEFVFTTWFNRALIFLVISCPCALVISIPLSYFAGMGAASKQGILFKGSNYLDAIVSTDVVVFDKTGTLTTGDFKVEKVTGIDEKTMKTVAAIEHSSSHPIAQAILKYCPTEEFVDSEEIAGHGLRAGEWWIGNLKLLSKQKIDYPQELNDMPETLVVIAKNNQFIGYITLTDTMKPEAKQAIDRLNMPTAVLSGDKQALVDKVIAQLGITKGYGDLLPEDKVRHIEALQKQGKKVAFVGDGINDAPVLATSDVSIAMGALGSDMAIETANIIIQTDQPSKVATAIKVGSMTKRIVKQNMVLAIGIKLIVMILGLFGIANLWEAVFADSGVALLAVLNSTRIFLKVKV